MKLHNLSPAEGAKKTEKRLGRGIGSGLGKTSGKGHKGQNARSGGGVRLGFEGGQMPLIRRLPKRGFTNNWRKIYTVVNVGDLNRFEDGATVSLESVCELGITKPSRHSFGLKVLGGGELTKKLNVEAVKFTASAIEAIQKAGGTHKVL